MWGVYYVLMFRLKEVRPTPQNNSDSGFVVCGLWLWPGLGWQSHWQDFVAEAGASRKSIGSGELLVGI
jgi:hypothetical protein